MKVNLHAPSHGVHYVTVETSLGDVEWELGFQEKELAQKFVEAFKKQAAAGEADKAREVCILSESQPVMFERSLFWSHPFPLSFSHSTAPRSHKTRE